MSACVHSPPILPSKFVSMNVQSISIDLIGYAMALGNENARALYIGVPFSFSSCSSNFGNCDLQGMRLLPILLCSIYILIAFICRLQNKDSRFPHQICWLSNYLGLRITLPPSRLQRILQP